MKKRDLKSKLTLNKEIITNLNKIRGGDGLTELPPTSHALTGKTCAGDGNGSIGVFCITPPNPTELLSAGDC